jgi:hypothetical protein
MHAAQTAHHLVDHRLHGLAIGDIAGHTDSLDAAVVRELSGEASACLAVEIDDCDVGPELRQPATETTAEDAETAGDDRDLAGQTEEVSILIFH